ncbi:MAG: hypothetical protein R2761_12235 [Acidimicrobiales bacterium]
MDDVGTDEPAARSAGRHDSHIPLFASVTALVAVPLMVLASALCAVIPGVPWWMGIPVGLAVAALLVAQRVRGAYGRLLAALGAVPVDPDEYARYHNIVQGLSLAASVGEPDLYVVDDPGRNAAAVARGRSTAVVATTGLLAAVDRIALEAVVAECLVRLGNGDAEAATLGATLFSPLGSGPLAPVAAMGLGRLLAEDRDLLADRAAVALTRYPPGLSSALAAINAGPARVQRAPVHLDHVWLVPPSSLEAAGDPADTPGLTLRMDVLGEL